MLLPYAFLPMIANTLHLHVVGYVYICSPWSSSFYFVSKLHSHSRSGARHMVRDGGFHITVFGSIISRVTSGDLLDDPKWLNTESQLVMGLAIVDRLLAINF